MKNEKTLRQAVLKKVIEFYRQSRTPAKFTPGVTHINYAGRVYDEKELVALVDSSLDFWLTTGRYTHQFENKLARFLGVKYCMMVNSGSSANLLSIAALTSPLLKERQLLPGDEVITTACGFPTTLNPILQNNLLPVFIDVDLGTYNINPEKAERAITRKTKAIFITHALGNPAGINEITRIAKKHKLWLVEDNCDSLGAKYKGQYTGSFGDISACSFFAAHHITTGEGGAVLTYNPLLKRILLSFRDWGRDCWCEPGFDDSCKKRFSWKIGDLPFGYDHKYIYSHIGYNLKATEMQAAIGVAQMEKLPGFIRARNSNFAYLYSRLKKYEKYFILPRTEEYSIPSWFGFPLLVKGDAPFTRMEIVNHLEDKKIATRMLFGGNLTKQPAYKKAKYRIYGDLRNTDLVMNNLFWIGVYPGITEEKLKYMVKVIEGFISER